MNIRIMRIRAMRLTVMPMDDAALLRLSTWLSPGFPVGAFSYSHGLEWAVEVGDITDAESLYAWLWPCIMAGGGRSDAILLAAAYHALRPDDNKAWRPDRVAFEAIADLALALCPSKERRLETEAQGTAFRRIAADLWPIDFDLPPKIAYPVAVGAWAAATSCPLPQTLVLYLHAFAANLVSAAVRLVPLGQTEGQRVLARLFNSISAVADEALSIDPAALPGAHLNAHLNALGGAVMRADLASLHHETQYTRLFRS
ncbi:MULTISPECIES: urease accessory protein UreF [unclassified Iodidimonas]|uniref:urease accessory protein UreF n=1 Tax=unclassified Iodidimonas TaxID=2626145 RepID=UPI0024829052|nr:MULTISPECIES: urease accessory protein UreF [unclassified Iodidimonas]